MTSLRIFLSRLRGLFQKRRLEREMQDEITVHLEMQIEDHVRQGMSPEEARYLALRKFGGVEQVKETHRERRSLASVETFLRDLNYGLRMLRRSPGVTAVAVLSLALGIGANTALFSVVDAVLLKTLPVEDPERLVVFEWQAGRQYRTSGMSGTSNVDGPPGTRSLSLFRYDVFEKLHRAQAATTESPLSDLFAFTPLPELTAKFGDQAEVINGQAVSGNYFNGLRLNPTMGRALAAEDDRPGAAPVVVLSYQLWQDRFGANPNVIGQPLKLNQQSLTIIGVTPRGFNGALQVGYHPAVTVPLSIEPLLRGENSNLATATSPGVWWLNVMGRLKPGASEEQVRQALNSAFQTAALEAMPPPRKSSDPAQLAPKDYPRLIFEPGNLGMMDRRKSYASTIYGLFIVVALVLLIACANLANLLLARGTLRGPEISVRVAIGAGRWRLIRQLLTESLLLATLGGALGVLFAFWGKSALVALTDNETGLLPNGVELSLNWRVLVFTLAVSLLTGVLFGFVPAWRATTLDVSTTLKQSGRTTGRVSRLSKGLLVVQVALSALLLVGAGLFIRTLYNLQRVKLGFNPENLLVFRLQPERAGYKDEQLLRFYQQLFDRLDHLPAVSGATFARVELVANENWSNGFLLPGETVDTAAEHETMRQMVRENYFATMEILFLRGREFTPQDNLHAPAVAIVNQAFQHEFFPGEEVLGKRVRFTDDNQLEVEIVGVVGDTKYDRQRDQNQPLLYTPWQQELANIGEMHFALRTIGNPPVLAEQVRQVVRELDSNLPVTQVGTQSARAEATLGQERLYARLLSFFGILALVLAAIGLFGVLAYSVSQRTKEIGIRMAFGARAAQVIRLVIWQGMKLVLLGLVVSALLGYALKRLLESQYFAPDSWQQQMAQQLYGVKVNDPLTLLAIATLLTLVALLSCWLPARRAAKVDPLVALRYE
ncbi:MAG TPA: ABC transporter permease [Pyrinomonadaceae bacterium]|nr:ABC transporter permease [Pyrinomonadaceae bacterium]